MLRASEESVLKQVFANDAYPTQDIVRNLSKTLGFCTTKVYYWFCRERCNKMKIQVSKPRELMISKILKLVLVKLLIKNLECTCTFSCIHAYS